MILYFSPLSCIFSSMPNFRERGIFGLGAMWWRRPPSTRFLIAANCTVLRRPGMCCLSALPPHPSLAWTHSWQKKCSQSMHTHVHASNDETLTRPFRVALIGRPNVGKSTLFNRLTGTAKGRWTGGTAIVTPIPGTTRDRKTGPCSYAGISMVVTDTGGLVEEDEVRIEDEAGDVEGEEVEDMDPRGLVRERVRAQRKQIQELINAQVAQAVKESDAVLFLVDARAGVGPGEAHVAGWLHKVGASGKTILVANKVEGGVSSDMQTAVYDAYAFGLGDPVAISAAHNEGISELATLLVEKALSAGLQGANAPGIDAGRHHEKDAPGGCEGEKEEVVTVAFVGLPNAGKSSLVNAALEHLPRAPPGPEASPDEDTDNVDSTSEEVEGSVPAALPWPRPLTASVPRMITSEVAGTTRDVVAVDYAYRGRRLRLVDTAGIRKRGRQDHRNLLEQWSVAEAFRAVQFANVVVLVLDAQHLRLRRQEQRVASRAFQEGRALVVVANKSDLLQTSPGLYAQNVRDQLHLLSPQLGSLPVLATSALTRQGIGSILPAVLRAYRAWNTRVSTGLLNRWLLETQRLRASPLTATTRKVVKMKYISQIKTRPPTFALVTNRAGMEESYVKFLKNHLRDSFGLHGMEVRLLLRSTGGENNPYAAKAAAEAAERKKAWMNRQKKKWAQESQDVRSGKAKRDDVEERVEQERKKRRQLREMTKHSKVEARNKRRAYNTRVVGLTRT